MGKVQGDSKLLVTDAASSSPLAQRTFSPPSPEAGAVCGNATCTDLYGGCLVRSIPTVTLSIGRSFQRR